MTEEPQEQPTPGPLFTPEQAAAILREAQRERYQTCWQEIQQVLRKHRCDLVGQPVLTPDGRITANVALVDVPNAGGLGAS